ncbi:RsiV family protein [Clostridium sp. OS1-26]|uniref:RsiV family protein n=1 Tax=Clostridium sp. OS1-26 TaxID=3070681 RepID=UPI0027E11952|nr:RsiV family protein [Clostridium sp. OS1-26]WML34488.1 RsiV family protein [Clostridium sp. OS1-26]
MRNEKLNQLKMDYMNIPIPKELDSLVQNTLDTIGVNTSKRKNKYRSLGAVAASIAAAVIILTAGINASPAFAQTLSEVPIGKSLVKVLTFKNYTINEDKFKANIKTPEITGLQNKSLEKYLNEKYLNENKKLYNQFMVDMKNLKQSGGGHLGVDSGYVVKTDTDRILSIGRCVVNTVGSSSTTLKYDTIDKKNEVMITLPSLFKDDRYIGAVSENIKEQMNEQYKADKDKFYWVAGIEQKSTMELFQQISSNQNFYINAENKLVISFNKYEVAPGYMGVVEFVIPTEVVSDILVSNEYIK